MAINVEFKQENNLLRVTAKGIDESLEHVKEYGLKVLNELNSFHCTRVLCNELDLKYSIPTFDIYEYAKFLSENAPRIGKAAVVCSSEGISDARFWETVSVNRGLTVKVFNEINEAEAWLAK
ncbi:MAG: hypothetical protein Q7V19_17290, partial [Bacteroidales bacterium]|nr:hypothetical protein [Bacteroidales bacterium]